MEDIRSPSAVDDDPDALQLLSDALATVGAEVVCASTGAGAVWQAIQKGAGEGNVKRYRFSELVDAVAAAYNRLWNPQA